MALKPMTLASANSLMVLTSLPSEAATAARVMVVYRLRWQIELAFKQLKTGLGLHQGQRMKFGPGLGRRSSVS